MAKFQPGQSGNPGGRPAGEAKVRSAAQEHTEAAIGVLASALSDPDPRVQIKAAEVLLDRGWGKATQPVTGEDGGPVEVKNLLIEFVRPST